MWGVGSNDSPMQMLWEWHEVNIYYMFTPSIYPENTNLPAESIKPIKQSQLLNFWSLLDVSLWKGAPDNQHLKFSILPLCSICGGWCRPTTIPPSPPLPHRLWEKQKQKPKRHRRLLSTVFKAAPGYSLFPAFPPNLAMVMLQFSGFSVDDCFLP